MRKLLSIAATFALIALGLQSCSTEVEAPQEELLLGRCLVPTNPVAKISEGSTVTFSWDITRGATEFVLEVATDDDFNTIVHQATISPSDVPYTHTFEADQTYYARVKGICTDDRELEDSKWSLFSSIKTYAVKASLHLEVSDRSSTSITYKWNQDNDVTHLLLNCEGAEEALRHDLTADEIASATATVTGLTPSTSYDANLYFKSAECGFAKAWTRPNTDGATEVKNSAELNQALKDKAPVIKLTNAEEAYEIENFDVEGKRIYSAELSSSLTIYGEGKADGTNPTIVGSFSLLAGVGTIHFESVTFDGTNDGGLLTNSGASDLVIEVINCEVANYSKALYSNNTAGASTSSITFNSVYAHDINAEGLGGGDFIDIRQGATGEIKVLNSTFSFAARTFLRVSDNAIANSIEVNNCTFNAVTATKTSSNNAGIFGVRTKVSENLTKFSCTNCIFLNERHDNEVEDESGKQNWVRLVRNSTDSYFPTCDNNYYYNVGLGWWISSAVQKEGLDYSADTAAGEAMHNGVVLEDDPCKNSIAGKLYLTNPEIAAKKIGDPRWWGLEEKVVVRETELVTVTEDKTWDFTVKTIYDSEIVSGSTIIDNIRIYASEIVMGDGIHFTAPASFNGEEPASNAVAFRVNNVGTVRVKAVGETPNAMLQVLVGGDRYSVQADGQTHSVALGDIAGETMIYVVAANASVLKTVEWSTAIIQDPTVEVLKTPSVSLSESKVDQGTSQEVVASWKAVENAETYVLTFRGLTVEQTATSYTISAEEVASLAVGEYELTVVAKPVSTSTKFVESEAGSAVLTIKKVVVGGEKTLTWNFTDPGFTPYYEAIGTSNNSTYEDTWDGLQIISGSGSLKVGTTTIDGADVRYVQMGGAGTASKRVFKFNAPADGHLVVKASNTGGTEDMTRMVQVDCNGSTVGSIPAGTIKGNITVCEFDVNAGEIAVYPVGNGLIFYSLEFTYVDGGASVSVTQAWGADDINDIWQNGFAGSTGNIDQAAVGTMVESANLKATEAGFEYKGLEFVLGGGKFKFGLTSDQPRIQFGGSGNLTKQALRFVAEGPGTLTLVAVSSGDASRPIAVSVDGADALKQDTPDKTQAPATLEFDLSSAAKGSVITIYSANSGINLFSITYVTQ